MHIIMAQKEHRHDPSKEDHKHSASRTNRIKLADFVATTTTTTATAWIQTALRVHHY